MSEYVPRDQSPEPLYLEFPVLKADAINSNGNPCLNRWSHAITRGYDHPAAQVSSDLESTGRD